jgi:hypothetical protein
MDEVQHQQAQNAPTRSTTPPIRFQTPPLTFSTTTARMQTPRARESTPEQAQHEGRAGYPTWHNLPLLDPGRSHMAHGAPTVERQGPRRTIDGPTSPRDTGNGPSECHVTAAQAPLPHVDHPGTLSLAPTSSQAPTRATDTARSNAGPQDAPPQAPPPLPRPQAHPASSTSSPPLPGTSDSPFATRTPTASYTTTTTTPAPSICVAEPIRHATSSPPPYLAPPPRAEQGRDANTSFATRHV